MIYLVENTYFGLLSAVYKFYTEKPTNLKVYNNFSQLSFIDDAIIVETDEEKANRIDKRLKSLLKRSNYYDIKVALKSGNANAIDIIFNYICEILNAQQDISDNYNNNYVFSFSEILLKVKKEIHHLKGFIRFSKLENGIYYAFYKPDNDIIEMILPHFISRYKSMPFILHDITFNKLCAYNGKEYKIVNKKIAPLKVKDDYNKLFKTYYESVNISSRKNVKTMKNFMPKRYHVSMPERDELL